MRLPEYSYKPQKTFQAVMDSEKTYGEGAVEQWIASRTLYMQYAGSKRYKLTTLTPLQCDW